MAYTIYTTKAFVMAARDRATSDRSIHLFTEEAGALWARASGVRKEASKMRYALQPFSFCLVSLVRGKYEWRLTGAEPLVNAFAGAGGREARARILRSSRLLSRLVHGEEAHRPLFAVFEDGLARLSADTCAPEAEDALAVRMLAALGYVAADPALQPVLSAPTLADAEAPAAAASPEAVRTHISRALEASHL